MKYFLPFAFFLAVLFSSCKQNDTVAVNKSCTLTGRFFNRTILDKCPDTMPYGIPHFALEMSFKRKDTVEISNGIEKFSLPFHSTEEKCKFRIEGSTRFGDMYFTVVSDTLLNLYDSAWTELSATSTFTRATDPQRNDWNFENYLNECAITGNYLLMQGDKTSPVYFLPNGQLSGLMPYLSYSLCYAGDCAGETADPSNLIEFTDDKNQRTLMAFKRLAGGSTIQFYTIAEPKPDIKGERAIGELTFELKRGGQNQ